MALNEHLLKINKERFNELNITEAQSKGLTGKNIKVGIIGYSDDAQHNGAWLIQQAALDAVIIEYNVMDDKTYRYSWAEAFQKMLDDDIQVICCSFKKRSWGDDLKALTQKLYDKNVIMIDSSDNDYEEICRYPAKDTRWIAIGAGDKTGAHAYSNFGDNLLGLGYTNYLCMNYSGDYIPISHTSGAVQVIAGMAAILKQIDPNLTPGEFKQFIAKNAIRIAGEGWNEREGWGLISLPKEITLTKAEEPKIEEPIKEVPIMSKSIYLSPSTQENNIGQVGYGSEEYRMNQVADIMVPLLKAAGLIVYRNRPEMTLAQVVADSNAKAPTVHFAVHTNAANKLARGAEVFASSPGGEREKLARAVYNRIEPLTPVADRGVKFNSALYELSKTVAPAALVEVDFHDTVNGAIWIMQNLELIARALVAGILDYFGLTAVEPKPQPVPVIGTPIIGPATATVGQAQAWAKANNAPQEFIDLAPLYWQLGPKRGGVNPAAAYVQFAHETGFLYLNGSAAGLDASYRNPCGLKITAGGGDYAADAHKRFNSWEEGITAQMDHLALYAGAPGYPLAITPDPRHFAYIKGVAPTIEALGGRWAPSLEYGNKLVTMLKAVQVTKEPVAPPVVSDDVLKLKAEIVQLKSALDKAGSEKIVLERAIATEKATYAKYVSVFKDLKTLLGGIE